MNLVEMNTSANGVFSIDVEALKKCGVDEQKSDVDERKSGADGILVIGIGNIGGKIADLLLRSGLPPTMLQIVDGDTVEAHNIPNQLCGTVEGVPKVTGFKRAIATTLGRSTGEAIVSHKLFLGSDEYPIQRQIEMCENKIIVFAIDNTECVKDIYNNIISKAENIPLIIVGNFSRFLRAKKGSGAIGAVTMLPGKGYYRSFFNNFYQNGKLYKEEEPSACRLPNASFAGSVVANLLVGRLLNYLRSLNEQLPIEVINSPEAMAYAVGQNLTVNEDEEVTTYPLEHSVVNLTVNLHTGIITPSVLHASNDFGHID